MKKFKGIIQFLAAHKIPAFVVSRGSTRSTIALLPNGESLWIEVKSATGKMRPDQIIFQQLCKARNVPHLVVRSSEEVEKWLKSYGMMVG